MSIQKQKPGRPKKEPTTTIAYRVPTRIVEELKPKVARAIKKLKQALPLSVMLCMFGCTTTRPQQIKYLTVTHVDGLAVTVKELPGTLYILADVHVGNKLPAYLATKMQAPKESLFEIIETNQ